MRKGKCIYVVCCHLARGPDDECEGDGTYFAYDTIVQRVLCPNLNVMSNILFLASCDYICNRINKEKDLHCPTFQIMICTQIGSHSKTKNLTFDGTEGEGCACSLP
jgi:hypothetical protein